MEEKRLTEKTSTMAYSKAEALLLRQVRDRLLAIGLNRLGKLVVICPTCFSAIPGATISSEKWDCRSCGGSQAGLRLAVDGTLALGAVAAVASLSLLAWLEEPKR